jgi:hypothetical protein
MKQYYIYIYIYFRYAYFNSLIAEQYFGICWLTHSGSVAEHIGPAKIFRLIPCAIFSVIERMKP